MLWIAIFSTHLLQPTRLAVMSEQKSPEDQVGVWIGVGIAIGAGVGVALGNIAIGVAIGVAIGTAMAYTKKASNSE